MSLTIASFPLGILTIDRGSPAVSMSLANGGGDDATEIAASIVLPDGLTFASPTAGAAPLSRVNAGVLGDYLAFAAEGTMTAGAWVCTVDEERTAADCTLDELAAGASSELDLDLATVSSSTTLDGEAWTEFSAAAGESAATYRVRTSLTDARAALDVTSVYTGRVAATQVGAPLLACDLTQAECQRIMDFRGAHADPRYDNDAQAMVPLNTAHGSVVSSSTRLDAPLLPAGASVLSATLTWSANSWQGADDASEADGWTGPLNRAQFRAPGGEYVDVEGSVATTVADGRTLYQTRVDVTDLVAEAGEGAYAVADIALPARMGDPDPTYYAGFALTVIYSSPDLPEATVALLDGGQWMSHNSVELGFLAESGVTADVSWLAWETDRGRHDDEVTIDGDALLPNGWSGAGVIGATAGNAGDSTAFGSPFSNSLGTDAKSFKPRMLAAGPHVVTIATGADDFLLGSLVLTLTPSG